MPRKKKLSASLEDYLEAIHQILAEKGAVLAKDIAARLKVSRPSVTGALKALTRQGLVAHEPYGAIRLTSEGEKRAEEVVKRHDVLTEFFSSCLGVPQDEAEKAACSMEHSISRLILDKLVIFVNENSKNKRLKI